jgi:hypothetical protein
MGEEQATADGTPAGNMPGLLVASMPLQFLPTSSCVLLLLQQQLPAVTRSVGC